MFRISLPQRAMDLQQLNYFVHVCEAGSFSRAAAKLGLTQPTLSRQVGLLEEDLAQRLLERTGRGVIPTAAGLALMPNARALLDLARRTRDELRDLQASPTGRVTLGLPPRIARWLTVPLVRAFREQFPRASLSIQEGLSIHLREWLLDGRLDAALLFDPQASPQLACETLRQETLLLVGPVDAPPLPAYADLSTLAELPLIMPAEPNALRVLLDAVLRPHGLALHPVVEVGAAQTLIPLVVQGMGYTVLPEGAVAAYACRSDIQVAPIGPQPIRNSLVLATPLARPADRLATAALGLLRTLAAGPAR
ncbi:LysR substrate-binding domain-containing protein [Bordetella bronchiseptica]|uniref:LysR family transcriptional regulator n=1 Tax=Bordetella bronchiseptica TaxID=518 RepID=UPI000529492E|nr:LysR substrate-binding domain-containing protein [Bordetella bronchiseptica]AZW33223.1 LysR family transcriptional regulator [Bordetella bronchiseptica]